MALSAKRQYPKRPSRLVPITIEISPEELSKLGEFATALYGSSNDSVTIARFLLFGAIRNAGRCMEEYYSICDYCEKEGVELSARTVEPLIAAKASRATALA